MRVIEVSQLGLNIHKNMKISFPLIHLLFTVIQQNTYIPLKSDKKLIEKAITIRDVFYSEIMLPFTSLQLL